MIVKAAIKIGDVVWSVPAPGRHGHVIRYYYKNTGKGILRQPSVVQGFIDTNEGFVDRVRAKEIAINEGQIVETLFDQLYTEDLW